MSRSNNQRPQVTSDPADPADPTSLPLFAVPDSPRPGRVRGFVLDEPGRLRRAGHAQTVPEGTAE